MASKENFELKIQSVKHEKDPNKLLPCHNRLDWRM